MHVTLSNCIVEGCIETNEAGTELPWERYIARLHIPRSYRSTDSYHDIWYLY